MLDSITANSDFYNSYQRIANAMGIKDYSNQIIHYTNLNTLELILKSNELWFGSLSEMNDSTECDHFLDAVLDQSSSLLGNVPLPELEAIIEQLRPAIRNDSFISSWCEYFDADPDGKLSMWRGYGDNGRGIGLVIDSSMLLPSTITAQKLGFFVNSTQVEYVRENRAIDLANNYIR
ncbi:MAG: DUF2971 domain-containing protein, partial [Robiginitomaculum sp.]|nr:DUF2971 domain-containing protein [Robiginitomaculum sp.]